MHVSMRMRGRHARSPEAIESSSTDQSPELTMRAMASPFLDCCMVHGCDNCEQARAWAGHQWAQRH